ncbi:MAG TPA: hypothetical protein VNZ61_23145 [Roseomonas sp.]|nr:hypothetical protein [Roseomonas sp.]
MRSAEFHHGPYTIRTFVVDDQFRARAFRDGVWVKDVADWSAETLDEALRRMRQSLDDLDEENLEEVGLASCAG